MYSSLINIWLATLVVFNSFLAFLIFYKNPKSKANIYYSLAVLSATIWTFGTLVFRVTDGIFLYSVSVLLWCATVPIVYFFLYFSLNFPRKVEIKLATHVLILIPTVFVLLYLILILGLFNEIKYIDGYRAFVFNKPAFILYSSYIVLYFALSFIILLKKYSKYSGTVKAQLLYVIIGTSISSIAGVIFGLFFTYLGNFKYYWMSSGFTYIMTGFIAYAIVRHRLMDIRFVLRKYSVYISALFSIIVSVIIIKYSLSNTPLFQGRWIDYAFLIIAISIFPSLKNYYYYLANKYFFSSLYDTREVIASLSDKLSSTLLVNKIYRFISDSVVKSLHVKTMSIYIYDINKKEYKANYSYSGNEDNIKSFVEDHGFYTKFLKKNRAIIFEEIDKSVYVKFKNTFNILKEQKVEIIIPLAVKNRIIGMLTLGAKETRENYNNEDIQLLEIISAQSAIAIENALNYEEVKTFSKKLQKEVEKATEELIRANSKLRQLDQAKSEFVSIASHQLRTPLTVIKGYISMIVDGNFGKISEAQKKPLEQVYESNERLIQLVENLLNISRIESGRLHFEFEKLQLEGLVSSVVMELTNTAKKRGVILNFIKPKEELPSIKIDREKIRQVVLNLIDNSIKYSKKGKVTVTLNKLEKNLQFCVADQGMGISKKDLANLFKKFSRGTGTSLIETEGTGLGLYVADQMIKAHQGRIWAESEGEGKGSKFCFTLPIRKEKTK